MALHKAITAELLELEVCGGVAVRCYTGGVSPGPESPRPLLLLHSINAAPSAMEMKPLFEQFAPERPVFAPDLPGFGLSQRGDLPYSPDFYAQAIADVVKQLEGPPPDVVALSLTCEFAARAVVAGGRLRSARSGGENESGHPTGTPPAPQIRRSGTGRPHREGDPPVA